MNNRLAIVLLLIVALPLGLLSWFGMRLARDEQAAAARRVEQLMEQQAAAQIARVPEHLQKIEDGLLQMLAIVPMDGESYRQIPRTNPLLTQLFALDPQGELIFPRPAEATENELEFLRRTQRIWVDKELVRPTGEGPAGVAMQKLAMVQQAALPPPAHKGWHTWHWEKGLNLIFWVRQDDGSVSGAEIDSMRLLADLIELFPDAPPTSRARGKSSSMLPSAAFALVDASGRRLHQWGGPFTERTRAAASVALPEPLSTWRVEYLVEGNPTAEFGGSAALGLGLMIAALGIVMAGMAFWFYREHTRQMRLAGQRVSFVNQVSHELKTPLTNIRMYAELMDEALPQAGVDSGADDSRARQHLNVIVNESRRLSRLIGNILTFSRKQRNALELHMKPGVVDETIRSVVETFAPSLDAAGMKVELDLGAPGEVMFDPDAVEQILGNLISNAEKYAASGASLKIRSRQFTGKTVIAVADSGPGIPASQREKIFDPFYRISDRLTDGVAGTGIGLTLARDLCALHGGTIAMAESETGACFEVVMATPRAGTGTLPKGAGS